MYWIRYKKKINWKKLMIVDDIQIINIHINTKHKTQTQNTKNKKQKTKNKHKHKHKTHNWKEFVPLTKTNKNIKPNKKQKAGTIEWWVKRYIMKGLVGFRACSSSLVDLSIYDISIFKKRYELFVCICE